MIPLLVLYQYQYLQSEFELLLGDDRPKLFKKKNNNNRLCRDHRQYYKISQSVHVVVGYASE
jgi:hypothetical protein